MSVPFLAVRLAYACLSVFTMNPKWSILGGDIVPLVLMHSLMEYAVVIICVGIGHLIQPTLGGKPYGWENNFAEAAGDEEATI